MSFFANVCAYCLYDTYGMARSATPQHSVGEGGAGRKRRDISACLMGESPPDCVAMYDVQYLPAPKAKSEKVPGRGTPYKTINPGGAARV